MTGWWWLGIVVFVVLFILAMLTWAGRDEADRFDDED